MAGLLRAAQQPRGREHPPHGDEDDVARPAVIGGAAGRVVDGVATLLDELDAAQLDMPASWVSDVQRRIRKRLRDLQ